MTASDHGDRGGRAFTARRLLWLLPAAILLLLLTAFAGTSFWLGGQARQHLEQALAAPPGDTPSQPYPFKVSEYRRGFFSSRVVTELTVLPGSSARWRFEHRIFHGPLPLTRISGRNAKPALVGAPLLAVVHSRLLPSGTADQYITRLTAETAITMGGRVETFAQATSPEGAKGYPTWQTLRLHLLYPADLSAMQGELSLRNLTLPQNQPQLELARLSLLFHYHLRDDEGEEQPAAKLPTAKLVDTGQHLVFSGLRLGEKLYEEGSAKLEWRNLDKPALLQLAGLLPHLVPSVLEGHPTITPPMAQTLVEALPRLMARAAAGCTWPIGKTATTTGHSIPSCYSRGWSFNWRRLLRPPCWPNSPPAGRKTPPNGNNGQSRRTRRTTTDKSPSAIARES